MFDKPPLSRRSPAWRSSTASSSSTAATPASAKRSCVRRRAGHAGHRLPQRRAVLFHVAPRTTSRCACSTSTASPTTASFVDPRRAGPRLSVARQAARAGLRFQSQIYRADGETIRAARRRLHRRRHARAGVRHAAACALEVGRTGRTARSFRLERWIDPPGAAGTPAITTSTPPAARTTRHPTRASSRAGHDPPHPRRGLKRRRVLTWGPCCYYQKQFFDGRDNTLSTPDHLMRYDLEVSGFPSSHAGHLVLLRLKDQDYPGHEGSKTGRPGICRSCKWAKAQGAVVGFAHSGWGLEVKGSDAPELRHAAVRRHRRQRVHRGRDARCGRFHLDGRHAVRRGS